MIVQRLDSTTALPLLILSNEKQNGLQFWIEWAQENQAELDEYVHQVGVVLVRGFGIDNAEKFRQACAAVRPELQNYRGGDSPRNGVTDQVYTSTEYAHDLEVLLHNELSYAGWCPTRVFFGCLIASETGGETHVADGRKIYNEVDPSIRSKFERFGVTYLQHLWDERAQPGAGKSWQQTFETDNQQMVEGYLQRSEMRYQWTDLGIRTAATKNAVRVHSVTGEKCWHNQADQWHRDMPSVKDTVSGLDSEIISADPLAGTDTLGNHVTFGNGEEITVDELQHIRAVARQNEMVFPWQQGDVMIIDNVLAMHGRKPYTGDRRVLVSMA